LKGEKENNNGKGRGGKVQNDLILMKEGNKLRKRGGKITSYE